MIKFRAPNGKTVYGQSKFLQHLTSDQLIERKIIIEEMAKKLKARIESGERAPGDPVVRKGQWEQGDALQQSLNRLRCAWADVAATLHDRI